MLVAQMSSLRQCEVLRAIISPTEPGPERGPVQTLKGAATNLVEWHCPFRAGRFPTWQAVSKSVAQRARLHTTVHHVLRKASQIATRAV